MRHQALWSGAAAAGMLCAASPARAQTDERRLERALRQADPTYRVRADAGLSVLERTELEYGGTFSTTALWLEDSDANSRRLFQYDTQLYVRASYEGAHTVYGRARFAYRDFSPGDSFDERGDGWDEPFLDRYWYEFDLNRAVWASSGTRLDGTLNVRAGRQFVDWGAGIVLSEVLYAVRPRIEVGPITLEALAGVTAGSSVVDFDASRSEYNRDTDRGYFGGRVSGRTAWGLELYGYALRMEDYNDDVLSREPIPGVPEVDFNYDATYFGVGASVPIGADVLGLAEVVYQTGENRSDPLRGPQEPTDVRAVGARGQLVWLLRDDRGTRVELETLVFSGDSDRLTTSDTVGGNLAGTTDNAFNGLGFANTGLAFAPSLSNLVSLRSGFGTFPFRNDPTFGPLQLGADGFLFMKYDEAAPIDEPTGGDTLLGSEIDLYANYRITSDLALTARYGMFFPGPAITGNEDPRYFVLLGVTLSF